MGDWQTRDVASLALAVATLAVAIQIVGVAHADAIDEDANLRLSLAALGPAALRELQDVLTWPEPKRDALLRSLVGRPDAEPLAQLIVIADMERVAQLRLLRTLREPGSSHSSMP